MANHEKMYTLLFNTATDAVRLLQTAQQEKPVADAIALLQAAQQNTEECYMTAEEQL